MISLPFHLSSRDKAKSMFVKGLLIESNRSVLYNSQVDAQGHITWFAYARSDARYVTANQRLHFFAT